MPADRNLLYGILAVQMSFITRDALIQAMNAWVLAKHRPLGDLLREHGALTASHAALLERMVAAHLELHGHDAQRSLAALPPLPATRDALRQVADADVQASLGDRTPDLPPTLVTDAYKPTVGGSRFRILRPHAKGGLGEVFVAEDTELGRQVALKEIQLRHADDVGSRGRFVLEAEVTGGLEHPNIVPVYSLGAYEDGRPFYAMRFIRGDSLHDAIDRYHKTSWPDDSAKNLAFRDLLKRFVDVCNAMAYAHSRGVLHRDLKPQNVMLGRYGETLVVDWGLAKPLGASHHRDADTDEQTLMPPSGTSGHFETQMGSALGTPAFMSPEQAAGRLDELGPAADVYSLGATLYALLAGKPPFAGKIGDVLRQVLAGEFPPPRQVRPDVPAALDAVARKAMALRPADRYPTAAALADEVEHFLADEPVDAVREPLRVRARRWARKHPGPVAALAATVLVGVVGLAGGLYFVNAEKNRTEIARQGEARQATIARDEAAVATAVKQYLQDDLLGMAAAGNQAAGKVGFDPDLKVRDLVLRAAKRTEGKFADQPLLGAEIRHTLGATLWRIGRAADAVPLLEQARDLHLAQHGADHAATLSTLSDLAAALHHTGRIPEALQLQADVLRRRQATLGADDPATLACMNNVAYALASVGRLPEALTLYKQAISLMRARLGADDPATLACMNNFANALQDAGQVQEALTLHQEVLHRRRAVLEENHPDTLSSINNLAQAYNTVHRIPEAIQLHEEGLRRRRTTLGADHPETITSMCNLAGLLGQAERPAEAMALLEEALNLQQKRAAAAPGDPQETSALARTLMVIGIVQIQLARWTDADASLNRSVTLFGDLEREGRLPDAFSRGRFADAKACLAYTRKALRVIADLAYALAQPPAEVPELLDLRARALQTRNDRAGVVATAEAFAKFAAADAEQSYAIACLWSLACGMAGDDTALRDRTAGQALAMLRRTPLGEKHQFKSPAAFAAHLATDSDLKPLRERPDFQAFVKELGAIEPKPN